MSEFYRRFPIEKKEEFLNYVMLTQTGEDIHTMLCLYIGHHDIKNWHEAADIAIRFHYLPQWATVWFVRNGHMSVEWAMQFIENDTESKGTGAAHALLIYGAPIAWVKQKIERNPKKFKSWMVENMLHDGHVSKEWADVIRQKIK